MLADLVPIWGMVWIQCGVDSAKSGRAQWVASSNGLFNQIWCNSNQVCAVWANNCVAATPPPPP